jgi:hypothetical protein
MSNTKHTPGPWQLTSVPFELRNMDSVAAIYGPLTKDGGACFICDISRSPGDKEAEANAKLIAASPELLEALEMLVNSIGFAKLNKTDKGQHDTAFEKALAAIKKATE